jgi:hypothetical protein
MEITTISPFLKYFDNVRERTMRVASCIRRAKSIGATRPGNLRWAIFCVILR